MSNHTVTTAPVHTATPSEPQKPVEPKKVDAKEVLASKGVPPVLTIERNGVNWNFVPVQLRKKDNTAPDKFAIVPEKPKTWNEETIGKWNTFVGAEQLSLISHARVRQMSGNWFLSSINEESGQFSQQEFAKAVDTFSLRGETISALKEEMDDLKDELVACSKDTTMSAADKMTEFNRIAARMAEITETIEVKSRKKDENEASE